VLRVKLAHLETWTETRRSLATEYLDRLGKLLVPWDEGAVHHLLVARMDEPERVAEALGSRHIATGRHYPVALSKQPWLAGAASTPNAEDAAATVLSLPMDPLMTHEEVGVVCDALLEALS
jgi:dTDP-4-amino-4,6-dideoxygalactose transaminase